MENKVTVSKKFVEVFKNFNVNDQIEEIKKLSKKEIYLLLAHCLDLHDENISTVKMNFQPFREEVMEIYDIQDDKETKNTILLEIISETNDKYIDTSNLICEDGTELPTPYTKEELREVKISLISGEN